MIEDVELAIAEDYMRGYLKTIAMEQNGVTFDPDNNPDHMFFLQLELSLQARK